MKRKLRNLAFGAIIVSQTISCTPDKGQESLGAVTFKSVTYSGATDHIAINDSNATLLINELLVDGVAANKANAKSSKKKTLKKSIKGIHQSMLSFYKKRLTSPSKKATSKAVNTESCPYGGSLKYLDSRNSSGTGTITTDFSNCLDFEGTISGRATFHINSFNTHYGIAVSSSLIYEGFSYSNGAVDYSLAGTINLTQNLTTNTSVILINTITKDNDLNITYKSENFKLISTFDNLLNPNSVSISQSGRIYQSNLGYVDVETTSTIIYNNILNGTPDEGEIVLLGSSDTKVALVYSSINRVKIKVDSDGNSTYETTTSYNTSDIGGTPVENAAPTLSII